MREFPVSQLTDVIERLCIEANTYLPEDVRCAIENCRAAEDGSIAQGVLDVLSQTSSELVSDIAETGITLTGGCAQIAGMAEMIMEQTQINCTVADDPASCVAYGCGRSLAWINHMQEGPINIARKRIMRSIQ